MGKTLSILVLAVVLFPTFAAAADGPGTRTPMSPGWGNDFRERLNEAFVDIKGASGYATNTNFAYFPQPQKDAEGKFVKNMDGSFKDGEIPPQFRGVGAAAFAPNIGMNKGNNNAVIMATVELFSICHDQDELAFVMAHEMAHLVLNHPKLVADNNAKVFEAWYDEQSRKDFSFAHLDTKTKPARFQKDKGADLAAFQFPFEEAADLKGREIVEQFNRSLGRLKYKAKGSSMMLHAKDFFWVMDLKEAADHPPIMTRAKKFKEMDLNQSLPSDWNK